MFLFCFITLKKKRKGLGIAECLYFRSCCVSGPQTLEILKKEISSKNWYVRHNAAKSLAVLNTDRDALADILQGNDRYAKEMLEYQLDAAKAQRRAGL